MAECPHDHVPRAALDGAMHRAAVAEADRDRLADAIRTHRESTVTELTCCQDCRDAGKRPWLPEPDRDLYAALDQDVETFPSRCRCDRVVPCRHCSQEGQR